MSTTIQPQTISRTIEAGEKDKAFAATKLNGATINFARAGSVDDAVAAGHFRSAADVLNAAYGVRESRIVADVKRGAVEKDGETKFPTVASAQKHADGYTFKVKRASNGEVSDGKRKSWERYQKQLAPAIAAGVFGADQLRFLVKQGQIDPAWAQEQIDKLGKRAAK
jgi:hypothetical protein